MPSLRLNLGQTVLRRKREECSAFAFPVCRAAHKSRTNFRRNFVRDLDTPVRDLGAMRLQLNHGKSLTPIQPRKKLGPGLAGALEENR
jgi:hypothetical protein